MAGFAVRIVPRDDAPRVYACDANDAAHAIASCALATGRRRVSYVDCRAWAWPEAHLGPCPAPFRGAEEKGATRLRLDGGSYGPDRLALLMSLVREQGEGRSIATPSSAIRAMRGRIPGAGRAPGGGDTFAD